MKELIEETTRLMIEGTLPKEEADKILLALHNVVKSLPCGDEIWLKAQETDRFLFEEWFDELK